MPLLYPGTYAVVIGVRFLTALTPTEIIAVDRSEVALDLAKRLGAHHGARRRSDGGRPRADRGEGAHVVIDFVGEKGTERQGT